MVLLLHLILTTLAGEETQLTVELQEYDRFYEFENAVLEQLPNIGESSTFGCELDFVSFFRHFGDSDCKRSGLPLICLIMLNFEPQVIDGS